MRKLNTLREDFFASLVVFVVAVPLTLGIALASGVNPVVAITSAIVGGIIVGMVSGAPLVVSGPAAGLATLVFMIVQEFGLLGLAIATAVAGALQILLGVLRLGHVFTLVPKSILDGMLAAIGLMIVLGQLHVWAGGSVPSNTLMGVLELPAVFTNAAPIVLCLGGIGILIQIVWKKWAGKWNWLPGALPAVAIVTLVGLFFDNLPRVELNSILGSLESQLQIWGSFQSEILSLNILWAGLGLGLVASAESLLTARAVDGIAPPHAPKSNLDRELLAQGLGNLICSGLAAAPITGVMVRSAANVDSGAQSRASTVMHGVWILVFVVALPFVLNAIPLTALASVLIVTGIKLIGLKAIFKSIQSKPVYSIFWLITVASIMSFNLLNGLLISLALYTVYYFILLLTQKTFYKPKSV
jgi:MFS superfamily sulfate permease-like transporter